MIPSTMVGQEEDEAIRLGAEAIDIGSLWLETLPKNTRYAGITPEKILLVVDQIICHKSSIDLVMIYNFDLLLSKLEYSDRKYVWQRIIHYMPHRSHALLFAIPQSAKDIYPASEDLSLLNKEKRIAEYP